MFNVVIQMSEIECYTQIYPAKPVVHRSAAASRQLQAMISSAAVELPVEFPTFNLRCTVERERETEFNFDRRRFLYTPSCRVLPDANHPHCCVWTRTTTILLMVGSSVHDALNRDLNTAVSPSDDGEHRQGHSTSRFERGMSVYSV
jgi:hypothetical protein